MKVTEAVQTRRSVRAFTDQPVERETAHVRGLRGVEPNHQHQRLQRAGGNAGIRCFQRKIIITDFYNARQETIGPWKLVLETTT